MDLGYGCPLPSQVPSARPQLPISHRHQTAAVACESRRHPWLSLRCKPLALLFLLVVAVSPLQAQDPDPAAGSPLCNRTEQVRDAIVSAVGASNCVEVTEAHLAEITALPLAGRDIRTLKTGDFASLTALESLSLNNNFLTGLPSDIFTGLAALQMLNLNNNNLETLTAGVFADLSALQMLNLNNNNLETLPAGVFSSLGALSVLRLEGNPGSGDFLPIVDAGVNQVFDAGEIVTLAAIISDADPWGDNVTFVWEQIENGGDLVTLKDANTARSSFVMPAGTTALEFELTVTGRGGADFDDDDKVMVYLSFAAMPVCDRTAQVRDVIVAAVDGVSNCADVTESHLVNISSLILAYRGISALQAGDFDGLVGLRLLALNDNDLAELPAGIFDGLAGLSALSLNNNNLAALPAGVFDSTPLQLLSLVSNRLTALPAGIFSGLRSLTELRLNGNPGSISFLPIANAGADQTVEAGQIATLTAIASDFDPWRGNVSYVWAQIDNGGDLVALKDANTARPSFVMPASAAALEFELTAIGRGGDRFAGTDRVRVRLPATAVPVCGRTAQVRDAIVEAVNGVNGCADITEGHLAGIIQLLLVDKGIGALQAGDFAGLTELGILHLDNNLLTELPPVIFDGLASLSTLRMNNNLLTELPPAIFDGLGALSVLSLQGNRLTALPADVFSGLAALDTLRLQENLLTTLSAGVFSDLAALQALFLSQNDLTALPAGVFSSLGALSVLVLEGNPGSGDFLPIADAGADQTFSAAGIATLAAIISDADPWGDNVRFTWAQIDNGGDLVSLRDANTARPSFVMPAGATALEFELTVTGRGGADFADVDEVTVFPSAAVLPVCDRTAQVRKAIVGAVSDVSDCADITTAHLANISFLALADKGISALQAGDFAGLTTLRVLLLNGNLLTALPAGVFSNLTELNFLILNNNLLTELPPAIFDGLGALSVLSLQGNRLTALPADVFSGLAALSALRLNSNRLATLTSGIFDGLAELNVLDLNTNSLTVLPMGLFADLAALESLSLGGNSLTALPAGVFAGPAGLNALYLDDNSLTALPADAFAGLAALESLGLGGNGLTALPEGVFGGLTALQSLFLNSNSLTALPPTIFDGLRELGSLSLHDNLLTTLTVGVFSDLAALDTLLLNGNRLMELPPGIFNGLSALHALHLYDNSLTALPAGLFSDLTELELLSLSGNSLTALPAGLFSDLRALMMLFLQGNPGSEDFLPIADAGAGQVVEAGQIVTLTATASDADPWEDNVRYAWAQIDNSGSAVVLMGADTARPSFVMPAGTTTALEFELTVTGRGGARYADADSVRVLDPSVVVPVCDRTEQVRDAIVAAVIDASGCADVTEAQLADIPQLFITSIGIEALQLGDFSGLAALQMLNLNNNLLTALPAGIFADLTALEGLHLSDNNLTALSADAFASLAELETLDLSGNNLTALPAGAFAGLTALQSLYLDSNNLTALPAGIFADLTALQSLYLDSNSLAALPEGVFNGLILLETLYLNDNSLVELPPDTFAGLAALETLNLSDNSLTALSAGAFAGLTTTLRALFLNDNKLAALSAGAFAGLTTLRVLFLYGNSLAELPSDAFTGLTTLLNLRLDGNKLAALPAGIFSGTRALADLRLHGNPGSRGFLPIANAGADQTVDAGQIATLAATVSDTDPWGDNVRYAWAQIDNGGSAVVLMGDDTARPSFVMPAGATALEFELTVTGLGGARYADVDSVTVLDSNAVVPVCDRTEQVRDAIVAAVIDASGCADVTEAQLAGITQLFLAYESIGALQVGDFSGLAALETLDLSDNPLTELPPTIFDGLRALYSLDLSNNSLTELPPAISGLRALSTLRLHDNRLTALPAGAFSSLTDLGFLSLNNNLLTELQPAIFDGLGALNILRLQGNRLTALPAGVFTGPAALSVLYLNSNSLASLPSGIFDRLAELEVLYLNNNNLTALPLGIFTGLSDLKTLKLSDNSLTELPAGLFSDLTELDYLSLSNNLLTELPAGLFSGLRVLTVLRLEGNSLYVLPAGAFAGLARLGILYLNDNSLTALPPSAFAGLAALDVLYLNDNSLTELPAGAFAGLTALRFLLLDDNDLTALPADAFTGLTALRTLDLSNNHLMELPEGVFDDLAALDFLSLGANSLTALTAGVFRGPTALRSLDLNDNSLTALTAGVFRGLTALRSLDLNTNSLTVLPAGLFSDLRRLRTLFLQNNPGSKNFLPIANAGAGQVVEAGQIATLRATASDTDPWGDNVRYAWAQIGNGGGVVTLMDADTARPSFVMPAAATALEFELTVTGLGGARYADTDSVTVLDPSVVVSVCDRTEQVRDAIVAAVDGVSNCANVTEAHLAGITQLFLADESIGALQVGDFSGLAPLETLDLSGNSLTALSADAFVGLIALEVLDLGGNSLSVLPVGVFAGLTMLRSLNLNDNLLAALPPAVFNGLGALDTLRLQENLLTTLPVGVFSDLAALVTLLLNDNSLTELPPGIFNGLSALHALHLYNNSLMELPEGVFDDLAALDFLSLSGNSLTALTAGVFRGLTALRSLDLNTNSLTVLPAGLFSDLRVLRTLFLQNNPGSKNFLPAANAGAGQVVEAGRTARLRATVSDADPWEDNVRYAWAQIDNGGSAVVLMGADTARPSFVMPAGTTTALEFELTVTGSGGARYADADSVRVLDPSVVVSVCDRTEQVRDAIVAAVDGVSNCANVTKDHLAGITQLFLADESIGALQVGDFSGLAQLGTLDLSGNSLTALSADAFSGIIALEDLDLGSNSLSVLPVGVFDGFFGMEVLNLGGNSLSVLPAGVFADLIALEDLDLGGNSLSVLPAGVFAGFSWLEVLNLGGNGLSVLRAGVFADLIALEDLDLGDNSLSVLPAGVFAGLARLNALHLGGNGLTALPAGVFADLTMLRSLNLNENLLAELPPAVFNGLGALDALRLQENLLTTLPVGVFSDLAALVTLLLNDNLLTELPPGIFNGLSALHALHLYDNSLTALPAGLFSDLRELELLSLSGNSLTALPARLFSDLRALMMLFLQDNPGSEDFLPIANAGADQSIGAGHIVTLTATVSDADPWGDNVRYGWAQIDNSGNAVVLMGGDTARPSFVMPEGATALEFELTVTGRGGARYADNDRVTVRLPAAVVTLSGPAHDLLPADATAIAGNELSLVYSYSADDLRGRALTGSIEVAASIDGDAIVPDIHIFETKGEITVVLWRQAYPYPGEHELAVTLSLSTTAEGFALGEPSSITTAFSFLPLPPTVLEVKQAEGNQGKRGAAGSDIIELGYVFEYAAGNRLDRPRAGLSVQVDIELCADAGGGCSSLSAASMRLTLDDSGSLTLRVDRTAAALSVFGEADADSIRHGRVLLRTAGDADFAAIAATTTFSFAVADTVVTLSGPVHDLLPADATAIVGNELSLVYSYSADDLRGRTLMGNVDVVAAVDGVAITPEIRVDGARGEITIILSRAEYPEPDEHELAVTLSLSATATGFALGEPSSIRTPFSFGTPAVADTVVTLSGPVPTATTDIAESAINLVYTYIADDLHGRVLTDSIEVAAAIDGEAITPEIRVDGARGEITIILSRAEYPEPDEHELAVTLRLSATAEGFVLGEPSSMTTPFSFLPLPPTVLEVRQAEGNQGKRGAAGSDAIELGYIFEYAAGNLLDRPLAGLSVQIDVQLCADAGSGCASLPMASQALILDGNGSLTLRVDRTAAALSVFGEADADSIRHGRVLLRTAGDGDFAETAAATTFSFAVAAAVVTLSGPVHDLLPEDATAIAGDELSLVYSYSADDLHGRVLTDSIEVAAAIDGEAITPEIRVDGARGEITIILSRAEYPEPDEHELAVTLRLSTTAEGFVLAEPSSITTPFSFGALVVPSADTVMTLSGADTVVTLSGPVPAATTDIAESAINLVYTYIADDLHGRVLTDSIEVAAAIDGEAITPEIRVDGARGEITVVLQRQTYPDPDEHELVVSLSAAAEGFVLGEPSSMTTAFSFLPLPPTVLEVMQAEGNEGKRGAAGSDAIELGYIFEYAASNLLDRPRAGLVVQVDVELCAAAGSGCVSLPTASQFLILDGNGSLTPRVDRTAAALSVFGEADDDSIRHGRVLLSTAGDGDFAATAAATTFSFAVAAAVVTLSGPVHDLLPADATAIAGDVLSLVYSYSADDLRGRTLMGNIDVTAAVDGAAITPAVNYVDGTRGEITIILSRAEYPEPGEHLLAVRLSLSATAEGFVLAAPSSIATPFSFGALVVPDTVVTLSGPRPVATTDIVGGELSLVYSYSADDLHGRVLTGSIEVAASIDGVAITTSIEVDEARGRGEITVVLLRREYPEPGEHQLAVTLSLGAAATGFVLGETSSITTPFSFGAPAVIDTVVTLSGPVHDLLPADATAIAGDKLSLVYSCIADDLRGRILTGSIEVAAAIDGTAIVPDISVAGTRGEITVVLRRQAYPEPGEHELTVILSLSAAATGFVLGGTSSISTTFGFSPISTAIAEDGTCQLGMLGPGEKCLYRGSSYYLSVLEAAFGPQMFFFGPNEVGEPLNLENALNPHDFSDFRVYNLEAIREGRGYRIIRVYSAPAYPDGELSGSMDGATILLTVLFFFANLALGLAGGPRRRLWR